jgi:hypothetical protein
MKIFLILFINISFLFSIEIFDVTDQNAKINVSNLKIGQSGIIVNTIDNNTLILTQAIVSESNNKTSTLKFIDNEIIPQDAIPTSKIKPTYGDKFILNHLYKTSILIVPNLEVKNKLLKLYPKQNFLNEDFFASHLKLIEVPLPTKNVITSFAQSQEIGTIFIVTEQKLYILDSITFKIIKSVPLEYNDTTTTLPFLTKIKKIETPFWSFGNRAIDDYNKYYLELVEAK